MILPRFDVILTYVIEPMVHLAIHFVTTYKYESNRIESYRYEFISVVPKFD